MEVVAWAELEGWAEWVALEEREEQVVVGNFALDRLQD